MEIFAVYARRFPGAYGKHSVKKPSGVWQWPTVIVRARGGQTPTNQTLRAYPEAISTFVQACM